MTIRYTLRAALLASTCMLPLAVAQADDFDVGSAAPAQKAAPSLDNSVEAGSLYTSKRSFKFGQYSGDTKNGGTGIGDFLVRGRDAWDSGTTTYWELTGDNLGLNSRSASFKYGEQGKWSAKIWYDGVPYWQSNSFHTVFDTTGKGTLAGGLTRGGTVAPVTPLNYPTCPAGTTSTVSQICSVAQATPANAANEANWPSIAGQLSVQDVKTQRDRVGGDFNYIWGNWSVNGNLTHEHKEGTKENSMVFASTSVSYPNIASTAVKMANGSYNYFPGGLTTSMMYFPEPVNYDNDRYQAKAAYTTKKLQASVTYTFTKFTDNNNNFAAQDPFQTIQWGGGAPANSGAGSAGALYAAGLSGAGIVSPLWNSISGGAALAAGQVAPSYIPLTAAYSLPPSTSSHQVKAQAAYNMDWNTRVAGTFQYGVNYQDDAFNPVSNTAAIQSLPASWGSAATLGNSLAGIAENWFGNLTVTSRPMPKLNVKAAVTIDDRDNLTPSRQYANVVTDGTLTDGGAVAQNLPYRFLKEKAVLEAGYMILPETKITVSDTYSIKDSKYLSVSRNTENAATARVNSTLLTDVTGSLGYTYSNRTARLQNCTWISATTCGYVAPWQALSGGLQNGHPDPSGFVPYSQSARNRHEIKESIDWAARPGLDLELTGSVAADYYPSNTYGVKNSTQWEINPNISYAPNAKANYNLFYSYTEMYQGAAFNQPGNPVFTTKTTDTSHTVGASANWKPMDKLKISAVYNFSYGDTAILTQDMNNGIVLNPANNCAATPLSCSNNLTFDNMTPLPDTKNTLNSFRLSGEYQFNDAMSVWTGYTFQKLNSSDWTYSQAAVSPLYYNFVLNGDNNPSYTVHTVGAALRVKW
ncbi:MAG TPA: MtrB/PioB family outer membrane beta-barrel protein [Rhodospirillaceae bacterium]|nr:MtrB/PioB family outer membrane beta-barrel protein [Rhodospirillaceae bacterium]